MTRPNMSPPPAEIRDRLSYDAETGEFTRHMAKGRTEPAGSLLPVGYVYVQYKARLYRAHRLAWWFVYGEWPEQMVDHINGVKTDNRVANLRLATAAQNLRSKPADRTYAGRPKISRYKGVCLLKASGKWRAQITSGGRRTHIGVFVDEEAAALAYDNAAREHHGEFAYLNFPEGVG